MNFLCKKEPLAHKNSLKGQIRVSEKFVTDGKEKQF
jgi:hypothetical protein